MHLFCRFKYYIKYVYHIFYFQISLLLELISSLAIKSSFRIERIKDRHFVEFGISKSNKQEDEKAKKTSLTS